MRASVRICIAATWIVALAVARDARPALGDEVLVAFTFDEGRGDTVEDLSDHGNDGVFTGDPEWAHGKFDNAIEFDDGVSWVTIEDNETLHLADSDFTLLAWVNFAVDVAGRPGRAIMGKDEGGGGNFKWIFRYWDEGGGEGRTLNWHINKGGPAIQINSKPWEADVDKWYQVGVVRDGIEYTFYIDGKTHGKKDDDTDFEVPLVMSPLTIGWAEDLWGFVGTIDEVLIVASTLDDQAIDAHFDGGVQRALAVRPKGKVATTWSRIKHDANARRRPSEAP